MNRASSISESYQEAFGNKNKPDDMQSFTVTNPSFKIVPARDGVSKRMSFSATIDGTEYGVDLLIDRGKFTGSDMWCACKAMIRMLERHGRPDASDRKCGVG